MERAGESPLVYLDTHVVMWLYDGLVERLSEPAAGVIEKGRVVVSGMVELELQYLYEIGRIRPLPAEVLGVLGREIGLLPTRRILAEVAAAASRLGWTRDPFDRMIAAEALLANASLVTKDKTMLDNCPTAVW